MRLSGEASDRVGRTLASYRKSAGLSQSKAAFLSGVGAKTISAIEVGHRTDTVTLAAIMLLLRAYDVALETFVYDLKRRPIRESEARRMVGPIERFA